MLDLSAAELAELLDTALVIKRDGCAPELSGQVLALLFEKPSLRTRVAFEVAMHRLGGRAIYLGQNEVGAGEREPVRDIARVLSRMVQGIAARTYAHTTVTELARWAEVPVVNALSNEEHPCQALADLLTLTERFGSLRGLTVTYLGEGNNVARSLAIGAVLAGMEFRCTSPSGYGLSEGDLALATSAGGDGKVVVLDDPHEAVSGAAAIYTDVWASMGEEHKLASRVEAFRPFRLNAELLESAPPDALVMHDLPAHRGEEITDDVIESSRSVVFDQAENRVHTQQAVLLTVMGPSA